MTYESKFLETNELDEKLNYMSTLNWDVHTIQKMPNSDQFFVLFEKPNESDILLGVDD